MRIISGKFKSRLIDFPKSKLTRPMTDRTKETLFNIVGSFVFGKHILDLYAGSGSIGLEALSRGALSATFVDRAPWAKSSILKNLAALGLEREGLLLSMDVLAGIRKLDRTGRAFSLVFVDPPFDKGLVRKTLLKLDASEIVQPFGQVVVGHSNREAIPHEELTKLKLVRTKKIGQASLSFLFRLESANEKTKSSISGEL